MMKHVRRDAHKGMRVTLFAICLIFLSSCTQTGTQIGTSLTLCCPGDYENYQAFGLEVVDMPIFLRDYVTEEFDAVFQGKGLSRDDRFNDIRVVMSYRHINLDPDTEDIDPFIRVESISSELRYIARIDVNIYETRSNDLVWAGTISRIHQVSPGEYMHEDRAKPSFYQAFSTLMADYPTQ
ncbi:MAG: hypothetical protein HOF74_11340 [Gammaproteobacteria bacterium]|jgi:hypothetical protein|nr:hypothetical protein [Gammaproteobacteria bacterium]MBT3860418.1 hypothetical protein [Gammaproteobacteria bacterium]MBT3988701.1 hypothetical protein [Gammaproteobacteria bacterium]MBT4255292.1 hypothetical protein [Gammaproteobacteria bacterium]MBT4581423.1 hypothetical protein [Gammaproteobacteria bacterium]